MFNVWHSLWRICNNYCCTDASHCYKSHCKLWTCDDELLSKPVNRLIVTALKYSRHTNCYTPMSLKTFPTEIKYIYIYIYIYMYIGNWRDNNAYCAGGDTKHKPYGISRINKGIYWPHLSPSAAVDIARAISVQSWLDTTPTSRYRVTRIGKHPARYDKPCSYIKCSIYIVGQTSDTSLVGMAQV